MFVNRVHSVEENTDSSLRGWDDSICYSCIERGIMRSFWDSVPVWIDSFHPIVHLNGSSSIVTKAQAKKVVVKYCLSQMARQSRNNDGPY